MMYLPAFSSLLALLSTVVYTTALPAEIDVRQSATSPSDDDVNGLCSDVKCHEGSAALNSATGLCICPQWRDEDLANPCGFLRCPETTEVFFSSTTNQCLCKVKHITPVLIHQATEKIAQQNATIYAVQPYFLDSVISFQVQLSGAANGFALNASTTIAAGSIGTDPEPNLMLVPKNMKLTLPKSAEQTAVIIAVTFNSDDTIAYHAIIAVTFNSDDTIAYHAQLGNGTVVKLYGDKYVHDIDLIDPSEPPSLSILTSHAISLLERDSIFRYEEVGSPLPGVPVKTAKRGIEGPSLYTATFSDDTCQSITCLSNGGNPAMFNPFLNSCYCRTLAPPDSSLRTKSKWSERNVNEGPIRHEKANLPLGSTLDISKPSSVTCRHMIPCQGESEPYFDARTSQCLCVVYRASVEEPEAPGNSGDTSKRVTGTLLESLYEKRANGYLRCDDNLENCLNDPYHYRCDPEWKIIRHQRNEICEKSCDCGGLNLDTCLDPRGGCARGHPDHPGTGVEDR